MADETRTRHDRIADQIFAGAVAALDCFAAGMRAADDNSESARKLRRLIVAVEEAVATLEMTRAGNPDSVRKELRAAIAEARKP
jgi:hypothetical protein